jgi:hypothetical protein
MDFERQLSMHKTFYGLDKKGEKKKTKSRSGGGGARKKKALKPGKKSLKSAKIFGAGGSLSFKKGVTLVKKALAAAGLNCVRKQTSYGLKKAKEIFGPKKDRGRVKIPQKIPISGLKSQKGGFIGLISALSALGALAGIAASVGNVVSVVKKIKNDREMLAMEKNKNKMLENYFLTHAKPVTGGKNLYLKRNNRGFYLHAE